MEQIRTHDLSVVQVNNIIALEGVEKKRTNLSNFEKQYLDWIL